MYRFSNTVIGTLLASIPLIGRLWMARSSTTCESLLLVVVFVVLVAGFVGACFHVAWALWYCLRFVVLAFGSALASPPPAGNDKKHAAVGFVTRSDSGPLLLSVPVAAAPDSRSAAVPAPTQCSPATASLTEKHRQYVNDYELAFGSALASPPPAGNHKRHAAVGFGTSSDSGPLLLPVPVAAAPDSRSAAIPALAQCSPPTASLAEKHRQYVNDSELAYRLQLQETMSASLSSLPSSSTVALPLPPKHTDCPQLDILASEFERKLCEALTQRLAIALDLQPRAHDASASSSTLSASRVAVKKPFRLYFKGIVSAEDSLTAVGVAVCDPSGKPVLEVGKPLAPAGAKGGVGLCRAAVETKALIEGLHAVLSLDIKRVDIFFDYKPLFYYVTGRWNPRQRKIANLVSQVYPLQRKLEASRMFFRPRCQVQFVFKLARDAIYSQLSKSVECNAGKVSSVTCSICLEDTDLSQMFVVDGCSHSYCFSCMRQHAEVKLLHGLVPGCPHDGCSVKLKVHSSRKYLTPKLLDMLTQRVEEASVPEADRLYCPYPKCSALMSKSEMIHKHQGKSSSRYNPDKIRGVCKKCNGLFCLSCKERWHGRLSCSEYKKLNPHHEEVKLQNLAKQRLWRQCVKCNHMIELAEGCFHMTCRCGHEFCYTCGAEWKNKKATCSCPLWNEGNILFDDSEESDGSFSDDSEEEEFESDFEEDEEFE